jgi:hypothetical protein
VRQEEPMLGFHIDVKLWVAVVERMKRYVR